jgi:hypothetical protein
VAHFHVASFRVQAYTKRSFHPAPIQKRLKSFDKFQTELRGQASIGPDMNDLCQQIFCNVELNGENLEAVGFDMDFTLAQVCTGDIDFGSYI